MHLPPKVRGELARAAGRFATKEDAAAFFLSLELELALLVYQLKRQSEARKNKRVRRPAGSMPRGRPIDYARRAFATAVADTFENLGKKAGVGRKTRYGKVLRLCFAIADEGYERLKRVDGKYDPMVYAKHGVEAIGGLPAIYCT